MRNGCIVIWAGTLSLWLTRRVMTRSKSSGVALLPLGRPEAARIAAGTPGAEDRWADGFPRGEDCASAARVAAASADLSPFGSYKLVARAHGRIIGTAGFYGPPDESGEVTIGYGMVEPEWGHGYGTEAVAGLVAICRAHGGVTVINADTSLGNIGSQRVLEKNGFHRLRSSDSLHFYALRLAPSADG
jgi:RimJ/RimL family protein N-acetyltransferase